jgi:ubiquinone biosynthesis monooxygenase Coq7
MTVLGAGLFGVRSNSRMTSLFDPVLTAADAALRTLFARPHATRAMPPPAQPPGEMSEGERREAGALMRINHVGEVCAQALYTAQAAVARDPALRAQFIEAAHEETDHLAWTRQRLDELGARPSMLNPLWYASAFGLGLVAGRLGDPLSLGFVAETERQVEAHLDSHLGRLPPADSASRAVVEQMKLDEARHAAQAVDAGAAELPPPVRALMRAASRVMTTVAHRI